MLLKLAIVVPCYNEEEALAQTAGELTFFLNNLIKQKEIDTASRIIFVDDGSRDQTWSLIKSLHTANPLAEGLKLSRNQGHQNALMAGLMYAKDHFGAAISIDADLQDDTEAIKGFLQEYKKGSDIVYGVRDSRKSDSLFKRKTAQFFYKAMAALGVDIIYNHADYRFMSGRALEALAEFKEAGLFLRGIVPLLGFKSSKVYYNRKARTAGKTKYPLAKMLAFALDGIVSFSIKPLRFIAILGLVILLLAAAIALYTLIRRSSGQTIVGWTSLILSIWFLGGLNLFALGIAGEYIGRIYTETKKRPKYFIEERTFDKK